MFFKVISCFFLILLNISAKAGENRLIIASTTSVNDSGLLEHINNEFIKDHDIVINVLALGTGQALEIAKRGDADILLVHHTPSEIDFINKGYGVKRNNLMYNYYVIIGPNNDKKNCASVISTLRRIKDDQSNFLSRGDGSGTNKIEIDLWKLANLDPSNFGKWYKKIGQGMGATINMANELSAYSISDKGTWISFMNKNNLRIICENKPPLLNQYGIIAVNPEKNPNVNYKWAEKYILWILSEKGEKIINNFKILNQQLFFFNYK